jgi:hypothetical protein
MTGAALTEVRMYVQAAAAELCLAAKLRPGGQSAHIVCLYGGSYGHLTLTVHRTLQVSLLGATGWCWRAVLVEGTRKA